MRRARRLVAVGSLLIASVAQAVSASASAQEPPGGITDNETTTVVDGDAGSVQGNGGGNHGAAGGGAGHGCVDHDVPGAAYGREKKCLARPSSGGVARGDFNGDGYADLSIGVPLEDIGTVQDAGAVQVIYGSPAGLTSANQLWHEDVPGVLGTAQIGDRFGASLAAGNFNGDAYVDLAIGAPGEGWSGLSEAGLVLVLLGSGTGLTGSGQYQIAQGVNGLQGTAETGDRFGERMVWAHLNGGSFGDLAIGAPGEDVGTVADAGAVNVVYGSSSGLTASGGPGNQLWHQDVAGIESAAEAGDEFGASLTAGDFDGNSYADLAIGVPNEGLTNASTGESFPHAGAVHVLNGGSIGLTAGGADFLFSGGRNMYWKEGQTDPSGSFPYRVGIQSHAHFGLALAAGDMEPIQAPLSWGSPVRAADGRAELAVGVPYGDLDSCFKGIAFTPDCRTYEDKG